MAAFLRDPNVLEHDIIAVQEPWHNTLQPTTHNPISQFYNVYYADHKDCGDKEPRVCFFTSKRLDTASNIEDTLQGSRDVISMEITLDSPDPDSRHIIRVHSIYNEPETRPVSALETLRAVLEEGRSQPDDENGDYIQDIAIGDFNIHHPQWGGRDVRADNRSEQLLEEVVDQFSLQQHVPVASHTYQSDIHDTYQTLDLCFTTENLSDRLTIPTTTR